MKTFIETSKFARKVYGNMFLPSVTKIKLWAIVYGNICIHLHNKEIMRNLNG